MTTTQASRLQAQPRSILGKHVQRLRREGLTPIHLYGRGIQPQALQVDTVSLRRTLERAGRSRPVTLEVDGLPGPHLAFVRDVQFHPVNNSVLHVDFLQVEATEPIEVEVPIFLEGEAPAVRLLGGSLMQPLHALLVKALPLEIPELIAADVSALDDFEKAVHVSDLRVPAGVTILTSPDQLVARVTPPVVEVEEKPAVAEVAAPAEGEAPAVEEAPAPEAAEEPREERGEAPRRGRRA